MNVEAEPSQVVVWLTNYEHRKIKYVVTIANGTPQSYRRTSYDTSDSSVISTHSSTNVSAVPDYVRDEVERQMIPKGAWN